MPRVCARRQGVAAFFGVTTVKKGIDLRRGSNFLLPLPSFYPETRHIYIKHQDRKALSALDHIVRSIPRHQSNLHIPILQPWAPSHLAYVPATCKTQQHRPNNIAVQHPRLGHHELLHGSRERHRHRCEGYHQRTLILQYHAGFSQNPADTIHRALSPSSWPSPPSSPAARSVASVQQPVLSRGTFVDFTHAIAAGRRCQKHYNRDLVFLRGGNLDREKGRATRRFMIP